MKTVCQSFHLLGSFFAQRAKASMAYRSDFFISTVSTVAFGVMNISLLYAICSRIPTLLGWSFNELLLIYGLGELNFGVFAMFFTFLYGVPSLYIVEGKLDQKLTRPVPIYLQLAAEGFNFKDIIIVAKGVGIVIYAATALSLDISFSQSLMIALFCMSAVAIYASVFTIFASLSFWVIDRSGFFSPLFPISDFSRFPVTIYPLGIRLFLTWVIPFAFVAFYPATAILDRGEFLNMAGLAPLVSLAFVLVASRIWKAGLARYESTGT